MNQNILQVDLIWDSEFEIKMKALMQHKSQIKKYGKDFLEAVEARARHRGG